MAENTQNPFKDLSKRILEAPPSLKKKVMEDVAVAKLIMDLASLFTVNTQQMLASLFKTNKKDK
ncbi:hypothetical protein [Muriicola marianensis]|uniref:Uncharacterized protein n=1 Tax=Muriicola marianensis TaxID=1324801 RepID=A0ABQ1R0U4_9FLAO|nr:hypothetical protein [Muriicola marianensis]GGD50793.1 hypothetical protein GCM10011361_16810 [Muriicola marianensis]